MDRYVEPDEARMLKFQALAARLRHQILSGAWPAGTKAPPDAELVRETGYSLTTIRHAYELLVEEGLVTRRRGSGTFVLSRPVAHGTEGERIGVIVPDTDYYYTKVLLGLEGALAAQNCTMELAVSWYDAHRELEALTAMRDQELDGLIIAPNFPSANEDENLRIVESLQRLPLPVVLLERSLPGLGPLDPSEHVVSDHPGGAFDAVQHLLGLGHERIALVMRRSAHTAPGVHRGYLTACEVDGLDPVILLDDARRWTAERAGRAVTELRARGCTAALVFGDREAELLASTATRQGIAVPSELALVAYDDELAEQADIPLTAMSPAKHRLGAAAADVMLRRLRDGDRAPIHQTTLRPHLIIRESCGAMALERRRLTA